MFFDEKFKLKNATFKFRDDPKSFNDIEKTRGCEIDLNSFKKGSNEYNDWKNLLYSV